MDLSTFYQDKRVLLTGHTGFKGTWLATLLLEAGAHVFGYALEPPTNPSLFALMGLSEKICSHIGDIQNFQELNSFFCKVKPEIVFHLAAQPIVLEGFQNPRSTYSVNVMGTVNLLECLRNSPFVRSFVNVTTDKVYQNSNHQRPFREEEPLNGPDPYSNSKSCSELVTSCYRNSFFQDRPTALSTVRAGNVIGGGDFSPYRILPDCVRAAVQHRDILVRNPLSVRPYQHVLDALYAYLLIAARQYADPSLAGAYNVGPDASHFCTTRTLVELFLREWDEKITWIAQSQNSPPETPYLQIDNTACKQTFGWRPVWNVETAVQKSVEWYRCWNRHGDINACIKEQIAAFLSSQNGTCAVSV